MRLTQISIRRYRAFDQRVDIPLQNMTVLTGPNNLGKSTVLSALNLLFAVLQPRRSLRMARTLHYNFEDDYPKKYEGRAGRRWPTQIRAQLEVEEHDAEKLISEQLTGIPDSLEIVVEFQWDQRYGTYRPQVTIAAIPDEGIHNTFLTWLQGELRYVYIPAARNVTDLRRGVFSELISGALSRVQRSRQRIQALERLFEDVKGEVAELEADLLGELRQYLPSVRSLAFSLNELDLDRLVSISDVEIDDGAKTRLEQKGDGFKSIFTISLLQYIARQRYGANLIFGIEEPEAHLHSSAIYEIKATLRTLSDSFQVLVTTHSPILIQRDDIRGNVIVEGSDSDDFASSARAARNLADLRASLGIRPQENMTTAEVVVIVEGLSEERILPALLGTLNGALEEAFSNGRVRVLSAGGAPNVPALVRALARDATSCVVFLDGDTEGQRAADKVRTSGLMLPADVLRVPSRVGCPETEFEDLFDPEDYLQFLAQATGLALTDKEFLDARRRSGGMGVRHQKWSAVMATLANERGQESDAISETAKEAVANGILDRIRRGVAGRPNWAVAIARRVQHYVEEAEEIA